MGTEHTGIPLMLRNIQPPPVPVVKLKVNKVVKNSLGDVIADTTSFTIHITLPDGQTIYGIPVSSDKPFELSSIQYGQYIITEESNPLYALDSITPSTFTLSADNPIQVVMITNVISLGVITVSKFITGVTEDSTYFDITITGQGADPIEQTGQVRLGEPLVFYDLPFDDYVVTEADIDGYNLTYITPAYVTINAGNLSDSVMVVNEVVAGVPIFELTFQVIEGVIQWPEPYIDMDENIHAITDINNVGQWNYYLSPPYNNLNFDSVEITSNVAKFTGGTLDSISLYNIKITSASGLSNYYCVDLIVYNTLISALPILTSELESLRCDFNSLLSELPTLPIVLQYLNLSNDGILPSIPTLPNTLRYFSCVLCPLISTVPELPISLESFVYFNENVSTEITDNMLNQFLLKSFVNLTFVDVRSMTTPSPPTPSVKSAFIAAYPSVTLYSD